MLDLPASLKPLGKVLLPLPSGRSAEVSVARPAFEIIPPLKAEFTYGGKPITLDKGKRVFVELRILREMLRSGWEGVWVETYGGTSYLRQMISHSQHRCWHVRIPDEKHNLIKRIQSSGQARTCLDVVVWRGSRTIFLEAKERGRDRLTKPQLRWIEGALNVGLRPTNIIIVEWVRCLH